MHTELSHHFAVADAIAKLFEPYVETVIHDLATEKVVYIANNFSNRIIGEPSLFDHIGFLETPEQEIIGPYEKINWDGRKIKSVSVVLRSGGGDAVGLMCINMDVSEFYRIQKILQFFVSPSHLVDQPDILFKEDWHEKINLFIYNWAKERGLALESLTRDQKRALVGTLSDKGAFSGKNAAGYIARVMNMSRASVYNYLKRQDNA
jgi:predicted transcriptional regulator YheO